MMRHDQGTVGDVAHDGGAGGDIDVIADFTGAINWVSHSDHAAIADVRLMLVVAVIIYGDNAAADVGLAADDGIAEGSQMARLGAVAEARFFGLDEVADAIVALKFCAFAEVAKGPISDPRR